VFGAGGSKPTGIGAMEGLERSVELGAGEIMLTSMDRGGTLEGYDLELLREATRRVNVPIIASGGVGAREHLAEGISDGNAHAVLAASIFHFGDHTVGEAKQFLAARGVPVRAVEAELDER